MRENNKALIATLNFIDALELGIDNGEVESIMVSHEGVTLVHFLPADDGDRALPVQRAVAYVQFEEFEED